MPACGQVGYWKRCGCCRPGHGQQADCYQFSHHPLPVLLTKRTESVRGSLPTRRRSVSTSAYEVQAEMVCLALFRDRSQLALENLALRQEFGAPTSLLGPGVGLSG